MFHKTRFFRTKILDDEEEQSDKSLCKKKKEKEKKIIEFVVIIQMRIHLDVTSLLNPISGIILK